MEWGAASTLLLAHRTPSKLSLARRGVAWRGVAGWRVNPNRSVALLVARQLVLDEALISEAYRVDQRHAPGPLTCRVQLPSPALPGLTWTRLLAQFFRFLPKVSTLATREVRRLLGYGQQFRHLCRSTLLMLTLVCGEMRAKRPGTRYASPILA